jgi:hypothetical protein
VHAAITALGGFLYDLRRSRLGMIEGRTEAARYLFAGLSGEQRLELAGRFYAFLRENPESTLSYREFALECLKERQN